MKKIILLFFLSSLSLSYACDVCGCALGSLSMGILPQDSKHFIGFRYSTASFNAQLTYNSQYLEDVYSNDNYNRYELYGRYYFSDRFSATAIIPVVYNKMRGNTQNLDLVGLGDVNVVLNYKLIQPNSAKDLKNQLTVGLGITSPTGESDRKDSTEIINRNFQAGTGSFNYLITSNYVVRKNKVGANLEATYKLNTTNSLKYRFGNQFNTSLNLFYVLSKDKFALMPMAGVYFEQAEKHINNGLTVYNTGGNALFGSFGTQFFVKKYTFNVNAQIPILQEFNTDNITNISGGSRFQIGVRYSFGE